MKTTHAVIAVAVLIVAAAAIQKKFSDRFVPTTPLVPSNLVQRASVSPAPKFDLSNLPRALELPLVQKPLQPGDLAPDFELPDQSGHLHRLSKLRGQTVVLSFYPRDLTFSCVSEAISFDHSLLDFAARGTKVFSVSVQDVPSKAIFAGRYDISYPLLADTTKNTARDYRVLSEDGVAGRVTFVIGPNGRIQWTDQKVHAQTHATDVLRYLDTRSTGRFFPVKPLDRPQQQSSQRFALNSVARGF